MAANVCKMNQDCYGKGAKTQILIFILELKLWEIRNSSKEENKDLKLIFSG